MQFNHVRRRLENGKFIFSEKERRSRGNRLMARTKSPRGNAAF